MTEERAAYDPTAGMIDLKGKAYLPVAERIVWFRHDYPQGGIETFAVSLDEERGSAIFRAEVVTGEGGRATATGSEERKDFPQGWIEKAEAKAVGRALGYLGYGTAAAFDEGERVVDAPQPPRPAPQRQPTRAREARGGGEAGTDTPAPAPARAARAPRPPTPLNAAGGVVPPAATQTALTGEAAEMKQPWTVDELLLVVHDHDKPEARRLNAAKMALTKGESPEHIEDIFRDLQRHFGGVDLAALDTIYRREKRNAEEVGRERGAAAERRLAGAAS